MITAGILLQPAFGQGVELRRMAGLPEAIAIVFDAHAGEVSAERVRVFFDTEPGRGEAGQGADLMIEGPSFYAYPEGATGWTWTRVGAPIFQRHEGRLVCVVSHPALARPFGWSAELTDAAWQVVNRWPGQGLSPATPAQLATLELAPDADSAADLSELLAARPVGLSVRWNGGPDLAGWEPLPDAERAWAARPDLPGLPAGAALDGALHDAVSGERSALRPTRAWRRGEDRAWAGSALGVEWIFVADAPRAGELRLGGWLRASSERVVRAELGLRLPAAANGASRWWDDMENARPIDASEPVFGHFASGRYGLDARQSLYPFGVVERDDALLMIETDPDEPRVFALGAGRDFLRATYDLALTPETKKFPGQATFRCSFLVLEKADKADASETGFRLALDAFLRRHPDYAERRVPHSGLWMPFSDISKLPGAEDFGFSFFEKVGELGGDVDYAKANGILTLMYSEPWLYWLPFADGEERTPARAEEKMREIAALGSGWSRDLARSGLSGAARGADGAILMKFMDLPWNKGARMEVNSDPDLPPAAPGGLNRAAAEWKRIAAWLEDPRVDGIYLDSMDAIVQPDHAKPPLHAADYPATYTRAARTPVMAPNVPQYEFTAALGAALRARGKFLMANFPLVDSPFLNRWIDIPGEETDWWSGGQYNPNSRTRLDYRRALSGRKPFGFLQSTDFATFSGEPLRRYFETCLLYGFLPSFFSHNAADNPYWHDPALLERDRPLFRTFVPLTRRVADAGWHPVREARLTDAAGLRLEQFGQVRDGRWHWVAQNLGAQPRSAELRLPAGLGRVAWIEPLTGRAGWAEGGESLPLALEPHGIVLLDVMRPERLDEQREFLAAWRSGGDEAATALRALDALRAEREAGLRVQISPVGAVIRDEPSRWLLRVRNESARPVEIRPAGEGSPAPFRVAPGAEGEAMLSLPATEGELRVITWEAANADGERKVFSRALGARVVPAVEAVGPGPRWLVREGDTAVPLRLRNHSDRPRDAVLEWGTGASFATRRVTLAPGEEREELLPLARPASGDGIVPLELLLSHGDSLRWRDAVRVVFLTTRSSLAAAPGVRVSTDSTFGGYSPRALHDGVADGAGLAWNEAAWASEDAPTEHWVRFEFPAPVAVEEVVIHWNHEGGVTYTGREGVVLGEVATGQELPLANWTSAPGARSTRIALPRQMLRTVRIVQNPGKGAPERPGIMWVSEIEVN